LSPTEWDRWDAGRLSPNDFRDRCHSDQSPSTRILTPCSWDNSIVSSKDPVDRASRRRYGYTATPMGVTATVSEDDPATREDSDDELPPPIIPASLGMHATEAALPVIRLPSAMKALQTELPVLQRELEEDMCRVHLTDADLFNWEVELTGPKGSPYEGGTFRFLFHFPVDYPTRMPRIRCATRIFHCNIDASGNVCIGPFDEDGLSPTALVPKSDAGTHQNFDRPQLRVTIVSARGLRNADFGGKSDPYCICNVPGKSWSQFQTAVVQDSLSPIWNEEHLINDYESGDSLDFEVLDDDDEEDDPGELLGRGSLDSSAFYPEGFDGDITLLDTGKSQRSTLRVRVSVILPRRMQDHTTALDMVEALLSLLALPVMDAPLVPANARLFREDRRKYDHIARDWTLKYAL